MVSVSEHMAQGYRGPAIAEDDQLLGEKPDPGTGRVGGGGGGMVSSRRGRIAPSQYPPPPARSGSTGHTRHRLQTSRPTGGKQIVATDDKPPNTGFCGRPAGVGGEGDVGDLLAEGGGEGLGEGRLRKDEAAWAEGGCGSGGLATTIWRDGQMVALLAPRPGRQGC